MSEDVLDPGAGPSRPAVDAADEGHHPVGDEALWSESWYFDFAARDGSIGGWIRIGPYLNDVLGCGE